MLAATDLVRRTGAKQVQVRYQDDEEPTVWIAVALYADERVEVAAGMNPVRAMLRLCETLVDGGICTHCHRPTGLEPDSITAPPMSDLFCWYVYDPELKVFRRGCEGDAD